MADQKFTIDVSQALAQLQGVDKALSGLQGKFKETGEKANSAFVADGQGALKEAAAIDRLRQEYDDLTRAVNKLKAAQKNAQDPRAIQNFASEIAKGEAGLRKYEEAAKGAGVSLKGTASSGSTAKEVFEGLVGTVTKATIILAAIDTALRALKSVFDFSETIKRAELQFANFTGSAEAAEKQVGKLVDFANRKFLDTQEVLNAGKSLLAFGVSAQDLEVVLSEVADISAATGKNFNELAIIYGKARTAGVLYAEDINQLVDAGIPIIQQFAKQLGVSEAEIKKLASEGRISFEELQLAFANLTAEGEKFAGQAEAQANTFAGAWRGLSATLLDVFKPVGEGISNFLTDAVSGINFTLKTLANFKKELSDQTFLQRINPAEAVRAFGRAQAASRKELLGLTTIEEDEAKAKEENERLLKLQEEAEKKRVQLPQDSANKRANQRAAEREKELEQERRFEEEKQKFLLSLKPEGIDKDLELAKIRYEANLNEAKKFGLDSTAIEEQYWQDINEIIERYAAVTANDAADGLKQRLTEQEAALSVSKQLADLDIQIQEERYAAAIAALESQGVDEERIRQAQAAADIRIQRLRLESKIKFAERELEILQSSGNAQAQVLAKQIEVLKAQLGNLPSTFSTATPDAPQAPEADGKKSIFDLLGIQVTPGEEEAILAAIDEVTSRTIDSIRQITAARVQAAEEALRTADNQVKSAEEALAKEIELAEKGYASNVTLKQRELEEAKVQREKAVEQQRKAQRTQILLDTALQASSLATTVANLFKSLSALPFGTGVPIAIALSATMFAAFAKAKADALRATRARYGLSGEIGKDGLIKGKSHSQGGVNLNVERGELLQVGSDGQRQRIAVVRKERTAQYWDLLDAANRNDRAALIKNALSLGGFSEREFIEKFVSDKASRVEVFSSSREKNKQFSLYERTQIPLFVSFLDRASIVAPKVRKKQVGKAIAKVSDQSVEVNKLVAVQSDKKQTALLQAILSEMQRGNTGDKWTPDGKTKISGNTKTRYM